MADQTYAFNNAAPTLFAESETGTFLHTLLGMELYKPAEYFPIIRMQYDPLLTFKSDRCLHGVLKKQAVSSCQHDTDSFTQKRSWADPGVDHTIRWKFCTTTGIASRGDTLTNTSDKTIIVNRALSAFLLRPSRYRFYLQASDWCCENQGYWQDLVTGTVAVGSEHGRTSQSASPYVVIHDTVSQKAFALHLVPTGNWTIKLTTHRAPGNPQSWLLLEAGLADTALTYPLKPGETLTLPQLYLQQVDVSDFCMHTVDFQRFLLRQVPPSRRTCAPVVYNTWLDQFDNIQEPRLRMQLEAARRIGCEVFMVDAGWFGPTNDWWFGQVGNWQERIAGAFFGKMKEFMDHIRASGLGAGLWIEPERACRITPVFVEHPDWFVGGTEMYGYPDLSRPEVYQWIYGEMSRLVETYGLAWMKIDFNAEMGIDPKGLELTGYYTAWYRLMDELRSRYPQVFFEGCSGGGMRLECKSLNHFDGQFMSDNADPVKNIRMVMGHMLRNLPGRLTRWCVIAPSTDHPETLLKVAGGPGWDPSSERSVEFALYTQFPGMLAFSGNLMEMSDTILARVSEGVALHKKWREFIYQSCARPLTEIRAIDDDRGWAAYELVRDGDPRRLLMVWRLNDDADSFAVKPRGIDETASYRVVREGPSGGSAYTVSGKELVDKGVVVELRERFLAAIYMVEEVS